MSLQEANILLVIIFATVVLFSHHGGNKKAVVLAIALQFSQEFNTPVFEYRVEPLDYLTTVEGGIITLDSTLVESLSYNRLKTLVYHSSGVAAGMQVSDGRDFMNPRNILKKYNKLE